MRFELCTGSRELTTLVYKVDQAVIKESSSPNFRLEAVSSALVFGYTAEPSITLWFTPMEKYFEY